MKITEKVGVLTTMGILLIFIIVITSSYAYFRPTIQGNDTAKRITLSSKKVIHPLYTVMQTLATQGTYAGTYSGNSNDTYGVTGTNTIYYIKPATADDASDLLDKINVKFAGYCWQMFRTTDTGGIKLIYNGDPDANGYCRIQTISTTHAAVVANDSTTVDLTGNYKYSDYFTYSGTTFTLTSPVDGNYSTDKSLLGKYTCANSTGTCTTLYFVSGPNPTTPNSPYVASYKVGTTKNAQIGTSSFNGSGISLAYVGYKYGIPNPMEGSTAPSNDSIMGNDVVWDENNSEYILQKNGSESSYTYSDAQSTANYHYTCHTNSSRCSEVYYYYYNNYYIKLSNGDKINNAFDRMLKDNTYNSAVKAYLENWYKNNMLSYNSYIEQNAVYCNDRKIRNVANHGGWINTNSNTATLKFNNNNTVTDLSCYNDTDKFSKGNTNALLNYPVSLITLPEWQLVSSNGADIKKTADSYWTLSPTAMNTSGASFHRYIGTSGGSSSVVPTNKYAVRPVITLKPSAEAITGTGAFNNPYIIGSNS